MAHIVKKVKELAAERLYNLKVFLNGRSLSNFKKRYRLTGKLGHGGFGVVYRGIRISDELPVAVKFIDRNQVRNWGKLNDERLPMEICMLARCVNVQGVIKLLDWHSIPQGFLIVTTRPYPCVDLFDFIKSQKNLDEDLTRFLFRQIAQTVRDCAQQNVLHRDVKDENIVIDLVNGETSLIDFGAATLLKKGHYNDIQGTRLYCPPEWFLHSVYLGREAAVWSLGVLLYNMLNGRLPFRSEKEICTSHLLKPLPFCVQVSKGAVDLIHQCLRFEPNKRCTLDTILEHAWIQVPSVDWCTLIGRTYQMSCDEQQYNGDRSKEPESSLVMLNRVSVANPVSLHPLRLHSQPVGIVTRRTFPSKTSLIDDSHLSVNIREFMRMFHLQHNDISVEGMKKNTGRILDSSKQFSGHDTAIKTT